MVEIDLTDEDINNIFFISDTHFDHTNIIKYCNRPFSSTTEMNDTILKNWFSCIDKNSMVFFLGDMCFGRNSRSARWWLTQLVGRIIYIKGSHDNGIKPTSEGLNCLLVTDSVNIKIDDKKFQATHDPNRIKQEDWLVHGHVHNNKPFIDLDRKRINVSVDMTNYLPISLRTVIEIIR